MSRTLRMMLHHPVIRRALGEFVIQVLLLVIQLLWLLVKFLYYLLRVALARGVRRKKNQLVVIEGGKFRV